MLKSVLHYEEAVGSRTDHPIEAMWNLLLKFSDIFYLQKAWKDRTEQDYLYVATCIKQSHEYFRASSTMTLNTKPVLLYYSILNLTKATLFILNDVHPSEHHGLCKENLDKKLTLAHDLLDFSAEVNNGIFKELCNSFDHDITLKKRLSIKDFLDNALELNEEYSDYFNEKQNFIVPNVHVYLNGGIKIEVDNCLPGSPDFAHVLNRFNGMNLNIDGNKLIFEKQVDLNNKPDPNFTDQTNSLFKEYFSFSVYLDNKYYLNLNSKDEELPNAAAYFGLMFILSSIVRYKPDKLYRLLHDKDISVNWMLNSICSTTERVYPNLMLNLLYGKNIKFAPSLE